MNTLAYVVGILLVIVLVFHILGYFLPIRVIHRKMRRLLKNFDRLCQEQKWRYWIESGTLLGAVRNQQFIPWDDDVDVSMLVRDCIQLLRNKEALKGYGLEAAFVEEHQIYKVYLSGDYSTWIDIFPRALLNGRYEFSHETTRGVWPGEWFEKEALNGHHMYRLGDMSVRGPINVIPYLERIYGTQWRVPQQTHVHTFQSLYIKICNNPWYVVSVFLLLFAFVSLICTSFAKKKV